MHVLLMIMLLLSVNGVLAKPPAPSREAVEVWHCDTASAAGTLVTAKVLKGREKGLIVVAGVTHRTDFKIAGFDRKWLFGDLVNDVYRYTFIIRPDGKAYYYDYSNSARVKANMVMNCFNNSPGRDLFEQDK